MTTPIPFPDSYWVIPGKLLAGEYPGFSSVGLTQNRLKSMIRSGVRVFIDLTPPADAHFVYKDILQQEAADYGVEVFWKNYPISDFEIPSQKEMKRILDVIDQELGKGNGVYIHCRAGIGRTGTVVGCFLARHGEPGMVAIERIASLRRDLPSWWHRSPETEDQVDYILKWKVGQ